MEEVKVWEVVELLKTTTEFFVAKKVDEPRIVRARFAGYTAECRDPGAARGGRFQ